MKWVLRSQRERHLLQYQPPTSHRPVSAIDIILTRVLTVNLATRLGFKAQFESTLGCYGVVYFREISTVFCIMQIESGHRPVCVSHSMTHPEIIDVTCEWQRAWKKSTVIRTGTFKKTKKTKTSYKGLRLGACLACKVLGVSSVYGKRNVRLERGQKSQGFYGFSGG